MQRLSVLCELALMAYEFSKIAYWFSCYPLGITIHIRILFPSDLFPYRRREISDTASFDAPDGYAGAVYRT